MKWLPLVLLRAARRSQQASAPPISEGSIPELLNREFLEGAIRGLCDVLLEIGANFVVHFGAIEQTTGIALYDVHGQGSFEVAARPQVVIKRAVPVAVAPQINDASASQSNRPIPVGWVMAEARTDNLGAVGVSTRDANDEIRAHRRRLEASCRELAGEGAPKPI